MSRAFTTLFNGCAADPACQAAYPDSEKVFNELVDRFNAHPIILSLQDPVIGISKNQFITGLAWKDRYWSSGGRVHYSLVTLAATGFIGWLLYWDLLKL